MTEEAIDFQLKYLEDVPQDYESLLERLQDCVIELQEKQLEFEELQGKVSIELKSCSKCIRV